MSVHQIHQNTFGATRFQPLAEKIVSMYSPCLINKWSQKPLKGGLARANKIYCL